MIKFGAKVVLAARREDQLKALVEHLGANAMYVVTEVSKRSDLDNLVKVTIETFGQIDVFWNNAGIMPISFFEEGHVDEWDRMIVKVITVFPGATRSELGHDITSPKIKLLSVICRICLKRIRRQFLTLLNMLSINLEISV